MIVLPYPLNHTELYAMLIWFWVLYINRNNSRQGSKSEGLGCFRDGFQSLGRNVYYTALWANLFIQRFGDLGNLSTVRARFYGLFGPKCYTGSPGRRLSEHV
jgi:hypothetical protein